MHRNINNELRVIGLLRVMFDPRMTLQQQVSAQLESHFGDKVHHGGATQCAVSRGAQLWHAGVVIMIARRSLYCIGAEMIERVSKIDLPDASCAYVPAAHPAPAAEGSWRAWKRRRSMPPRFKSRCSTKDGWCVGSLPGPSALRQCTPVIHVRR